MRSRRDSAVPGASFAELISSRREEIVVEWERRARTLPAAVQLSEPALRDHVPELLTRIAEAVGSPEGELGGDDLPGGHAVERLAHGYDVAAATHELLILRRVVFEAWGREAGGLLPAREAERVDAAIDEVILQSVGRFSKARERTLAALDRVSSAALGTGDLETFLPKLLTVILETTEAADSAYVLLREGDVLRVRAAEGAGSEESRGYSVRMGEGFAGTVAARREPLLIRDAANDPFVLNPAIRGRGVHALYGVPLVFDDQVIGVAKMASRSAFEFSDDDKQLFRAMAQRATSLIVQAQLVQGRRRLLDALEHADAYLLLDREFRILQVNRTQEVLSRKPREESVGRVFWDVWPEAATPESAYWQQYHRCMRERVPVEFEAYYAPLDLWTGVSAYPSPDGGIAVFFRDVTARKRAEIERDRSSELLRRSEARLRRMVEFEQQLVGIVSHDLRSPLNAILLGASALLAREELDGRLVKAVNRIRTSAERATRMVQDLLDFTRARVGQGIPLNPAPLDLHALARQVLDEVQVTYPDRAIQLEPHGSADGVWDGDRLAQVLSNLLVNALKYGPRDEVVTVRTRGAGPEVLVEVHNGGDPIPVEARERLFEPYRRAASGQGTDRDSLGLGLYITREIVHAHGGTVEVDSDEDRGTTFTVRLPRRRQP